MTREMNKPSWAVDCKECWNLGCEYKKHIDKLNNTICVCNQFIRERKLNEDIAEFFWATCERYRI